MNRRKPSPEEEAYFTSITHLESYFNIIRVKPFQLSAKSIATVDTLMQRHKISSELLFDIHWIYGYVGMQYTVNFMRDKTKWEQERTVYTKPETKDGLDLYYNMNRLPDWEAIESITFRVKPKWSKAYPTQETLKVSYPEMIRFIIEAVLDKRESWHDTENKSLFFADEQTKLDKHTDNDDWYRSELTQNNLLDPEWRDKDNSTLKKHRKTKKSLSDYLTLRKKETIEELYYYLANKTDLGTQSLCRFGAELMFQAGVPFMYSDGTKHDVFTDDLTQYFKKYAPIPKAKSSSIKSTNKSNRIQELTNKPKNTDNQ